MINVVDNYLEKFKRQRRTHRRLICVLVVLAVIVVLGVYWQLRMTGAALANEVYCGKEEHTHDDSCYEMVLVCGLEESEGTPGHTHTEECYEEQTELICGLEECRAVAGHTHTEECYEEQTELTCGKEESAGHAHTDACYDEEGNLICGQEESAGHTHTADCYTTTKVLVCGKEEREAVAGHTHTEACYQTTKVLICGLEECEATAGHTHTNACYEKKLVCGLEEHTHTVECLIDETADLETASDWEVTVPTAMSGDWADDLVAVAKSQLGYTESTANFTIDDDGETTRGYTRYGAWAGNEYGDWDAMFVSFCLYYADVPQTEFPEATGAYAWSVILKNMGLYGDASNYEVQSGDLAFFDADNDGKIDRVGIVAAVNESSGQLTVIEGDYSENKNDADAVCNVSYGQTDQTIAGYGTVSAAQEAGEESEAERETETGTEAESDLAASEVKSEAEAAETEAIPEETESDLAAAVGENETEAAEDPAEEPALTQQTLEIISGDATITVSGLLPENATITAAPVEVEIEGENVLLAFDISIFYEDADGETVIFEPEDGAVTVTIESSEITDGSSVYYVPEEGEPEKLDTTETEEGLVAFDAEHFSTYAVTSSGSVVASGTIANGEGVEEAITWTIYEDDAGNRTLVIEGDGSIPDYSSENAGQPWYSYRSTVSTLILGEGITRVGKQAFHGNYFTDIQFSSTVTSIGQYAFSYSQKLTSVTIPGTITTVENYAFAYSYHIYDVTLEEGIVTIGDSAFGGNCGSSEDCSNSWITIPASVTSIGEYAFALAAGYIVADGNTYFYADEDGVLYSYDGTTLIDYPKRRVAVSWTIPEKVTTVKKGALQNVKYTSEIYVMHQVSLPTQAFRDSNYTYVYIADDVSIPLTDSLMFYNDPYLTAVHLPENTPLRIYNQYFNSDSQLASLKIPKGTTQIDNLAFSGTTNLETMYYDAAHVTSIHSAIFGTSTMPQFDLTIGTNVDYLVADFSYILEHATSLTIEGPNAFYIEDGAFAKAPAPYTGLSGWIYVTEDGVVYTLDTDTNEATLVYVPDGVTSLTIPAAITDALDGTEEVTFTVTTVAKDALKYAEDLTELTFEDASKITTLENYALANAPITSVTDKAANSGAGSTATTVADATALFTNAEIGYNVFYNTELGGAVAAKNYATDMDGSDSVTVSCMTINVIKGDTTEWIETDDDNTTTVGGYSSLTGDTVQFSISVSNNSGSAQTYRVYVQVSEDDCSLNYTAGETFTVNGVTVTASATDDPYTMCLEFTVEEGQTVNFTVNAIYDTPTSDGGGVTVWGALVETDPLGAVTETETDGEIEAYWTTLRDTYTLAKNNNSQTSVIITADDDGTVRPSAELKWQITLTSEGDLSAYGEDYVTVVTYTDVMTLPAGMEWDADILAAIKAGTVVTRNNVLYEGTTKIAALSLGTTTSLSLSGLSVSYDDATDQVILTWKVRNTGDVNINTNTLNLTVYPEALTVDMTTYDTTAANEITNTADATVKYTYGSPTEQEASVTKTVTGGEGTVKLSKTGTDVTYFGEDLTYTLKVYNDGGLPYKDYQAYTLTDALESNFYISADNMEKMFVEAAADGAELVITIAKASLAATGGSVTDTNGTAGGAYVNTGNSDLDETDGNTLVITYIETTGLYTVTVNGDSASAINGASIESLLQSLGYGVTSAVTYTCVWTLPTTTEDVSRTPTTLFTLTGGGSYTYSIYATVKSTFQKLDDSDWPSEYPKTSALNLNNSATLASADNKTKKTVKADTDSVVREAVIGKSASLDGKDLGSAPEASDGDVLDYTLTFTHYGDGSYDDLPMVDDLYGSQYLLVPYTQNSSNGSIAAAGVTSGTWSGTGVKTYDSDGDGEPDYYVLGVGTYTDVVVGQDADGNWMTAASITVTSGEDQSVELDGATNTWSGVHSQIKWYFDELDGGNYTIQISYKALVDITGYEASYTIGNVVWMNDRTGSRIYAGLWGGGTIIGYDKDIVVDQGSDGDEDNDGLDDDKYTSVKEGETVTYRLTLESTGDAGTFVLTGANIADQLPNTYGVFAWTTDNVKITKIEVDDSAGGSVTNAESLSNSSNWSISESYNGISGTGTYFIVWDDDVSVYFSQNVSVYIYVELTYPTNSERTTDADGNDVGVWNQYADEAQGTTLNNTFYVYRNPANVTHVLAREGEVTLQKGVYALARSTSSMGIGTSSGGTYYATGTDRNYYNNQDSSYRYAVYYVSIYNGASTRLYLNDLYDQLPEGFVYTTLLPSGFNYSFGSHLASIHTITTLSSSSNLNTWLVQTDSDTTYMSAGVSASVNCDGTLVFTFSSGSGDYALKYDEDLGQYYLDKGEAIVFGYICEIGLTADTEDEATNTIAMSYTDYADAGVTESDKSFEARNYEPYGSSDNDGDCTIETSDTVQTEYGFDDGEGNSSWLVSGVTLERGGIKPGIDKETVSYQSSTTSTVYAYENSVTATDLINWEVTLVNGGTMSIVDYVVTDIMPNPYVFTGPVAFTAYDSTGSSQISGTLFTINTSPDTISNLSALNETTLPSLSVTPSNSSTATEVKTDGTVYSMTASLTNTTATFTLCFYFDDDNNLVMEIGMKDAKLDVPEGGKLEITYTSWNPTTTQASTTYINQVTLTPSQSFTSSDIQSGSAVAGAYGTVLGARTVSPVTVAAGYSSNSWKSVTESDQGGNTGNTAVSTGSDNTIALSAPDSVFTYTLNVENVNDVAITKLVLIDNLPYEGDTYAFNDELERDSEYTVVLASSDFEVVITNADNTTETLTAGTDYKVEYSSKTENFSGDDRSGTASSDWQELTSSTNLSEVKSIRVIITKEIPAKATVAVSFDAKVSDPDNVDPGSIAWNNFGYRYQVNNSNIELEAMPLVVGVKVPSAPELTKKLVDLDGNAYTADKDTTFTFVIYEGDELTDANNNNGSYTSQSELIAALDALISAGGSDARKYRIVTITVPAGSSASDTLALYGSNGLGTDSNGTTWWSWEEGEKYTIAEFPEGAYTLKEWDSGNSRLSQSNSCTFTYNASTTLSLTCANVSQVWDLTLTKVDANIQDSQTGEYTKPLNGAVFALYTKNETLKMSDDDYSALSNTYSLSESDLPKKTFTTGEGASAVIWYLMDVQITDTDSITGADGTLSFTNLSEDVYYLVEVKAPDGYNLDATPIPVSRGDSTEVSKTVTNAPGYELPSSGGPGTWRFTLIGILLILCGGAGLLRKFGKLGKLAAPGTIMRS
ncbi:MAG: leucine-rich repeat protein [Lachnospiraceae bacterium]|nr:leucine-rich repeat protein [Lachnospiraceae bacterium]